VTGRVPLEVDHLNGNFADNRPHNVRLLRPNCHALTPTFKALNKGNRRLSDAKTQIFGAGRGIRTLDTHFTKVALFR